VLQGHALKLHEIGGGDGGGSRNAHEAVHEDCEPLLSIAVHEVHNAVEKGKKLEDGRVLDVINVVGHLIARLIHEPGLGGHGEDHADALGLQRFGLFGALEVAAVQATLLVGGRKHARTTLVIHNYIY